MKRTAIYLACLLVLVGTSLTGLGVRRSVAAAPGHAQRSLCGTLAVFDWTAFETGPQGAKVLAAYRHSHPCVKLKMQPMPPGDPTVWEESLATAGTEPDVIVPSYTQQIFGDLPKNYWLDLTPYLYQPNPYIKGNKRWIDSMVPAINQQNAFVGGKYYVVSWSTQDAAFFYNKDIFAKAGITHTPATWAELLADSARLKKAGYVPDLYFLGDTYPIDANGSFISLLESQVMHKTFLRLDTNHDGVVDVRELVYGIKHRIYSPMNPDYQEAWKLYKQWSQYWQPNAAGNKGYYGAAALVSLQLFLHGKAAMIYEGQAIPLYLAQAKVKFHWGVFKMPQITAASSRFAPPENVSGGIWGAWNAYAWAVPVTARTHGHLDLVLDFLHWITAPQNEVPVTLEISEFPVVTGYRPSGTFNSTMYDLVSHPSMQFAAEATLGTEWLRDRIATQQNYITGQESLAQAMADMQRYTDQAADRMIKLYHLSL